MNILAILLLTMGIEHGICYAVPSEMSWMANEYRDLGATWVKFNGPGSFWDDVQPEAHGVYQWDMLDRGIAGCRAAGLEPVLVVGPGAGWGSQSLAWWEKIHGDTSSPVQEQFWDQYRAYVYSLVDRYHPLAVECLTEAQHAGYWVGTPEEYVRLLCETYASAKMADPNVTVILSGMWFGDLFDDGKVDDASIERKIKGLGRYPWNDYRRWLEQGTRSALVFNRTILQESAYYDAVEFHVLSGAVCIPFCVDWLGRNMPEVKDIWIGDCCVTPPIPCGPVTGRDASSWTVNVFAGPAYQDGDKRWRVLRGESVAGYDPDEVRAWFLSEQVRHVDCVLSAAKACGIERIGWYSWRDWSVPKAANAYQKHWSVCGLRDTGPWYWPIGAKRPVFERISSEP